MTEAVRSTGLGPTRTLRFVVLPPALRNVLSWPVIRLLSQLEDRTIAQR